MNRNSKYAFYGTLRRGMENYAVFQKDLKFLRTVQLSGFKMYSLEDYPYVVLTGNSDHKIVAEMFIVTDPETEQIIHKMELDAGYIFSEVAIAGVNFGIYLFEAPGDSDLEVRNGDWSEFRKLSHF